MQSTAEFYRSRISSFENERRIFNEYIALITPSKGELHVLDWEYRQGIANASSAVTERERIETELKRLRKEIINVKDQIKASIKMSDARRKQIESLSELSQPVQKDATYLVMDRFLNRNDAVSHSGLPSAPDSVKPETKERAPSSKLYGRQARTGDIIQLENKAEEESRRINSLIHDLSVALKEVDEGSARLDIAVTESLEVCRTEAAQLVKEVDRLDYQGYLSVAELLKLRLKIMSAQREEVEELERLHDDKIFFAAKESQMRDQLLTDMNLMKRRLRAEASASSKDFQSQHDVLDSLLLKLKLRESKAVQDEKKIVTNQDKLHQACNDAKEKYERLRRRNALEMEGYTNEAKMLKSKLSALEALYAKKERRAQRA